MNDCGCSARGANGASSRRDYITWNNRLII